MAVAGSGGWERAEPALWAHTGRDGGRAGRNTEAEWSRLNVDPIPRTGSPTRGTASGSPEHKLGHRTRDVEP